MPHYKCVACKLRLHTPGAPPEDVGDLCPGCGALLEPTDDLAEIVGFRSIERGEELAPGSQRMIAAAIRDLGSLPQEAVAVALPLPDESK